MQLQFLPKWWRGKKINRHRKLQEITNDRNILQTSEYPATMDFIIWAVSSLFRWMRLKVYQYEVTFSLYMLTPIEKLIFSTLRLFPCPKYSWYTMLTFNFLFRHPAPWPHRYDRYGNLYLPPRPPPRHLWPPLLLLGRRALVQLRSVVHQLGLWGKWHGHANWGHGVRNGKERRCHLNRALA